MTSREPAAQSRSSPRKSQRVGFVLPVAILVGFLEILLRPGTLAEYHMWMNREEGWGGSSGVAYYAISRLFAVAFVLLIVRLVRLRGLVPKFGAASVSALFAFLAVIMVVSAWRDYRPCSPRPCEPAFLVYVAMAVFYLGVFFFSTSYSLYEHWPGRSRNRRTKSTTPVGFEDHHSVV